MSNARKNICPDTNQLAEFLDNPASSTLPAEVSVHIATCPECRDLCRFAAEAKVKVAAGKLQPLSESKKDELRRTLGSRIPLNMPAETETLWEKFTLKLTDFFSFQEDLEVVAASETAAEIIFSSLPYIQQKYSWSMSLAIPTQPSEKLKIRLRTRSATAANGKLIFCGNELTVRNGATEIRYDDLKRSFHNPEVAFCFKDGKKVPGFPEL